MNDETTWMSGQDAEFSMAKERYDYFLRPEPRDNMSDIYHVDGDPYLGVAKCRDLRIGMVRNAPDDQKKTVRAYLEPFPHIRIDAAKPLQGWYKSLHEPPGVRPRPCFTEAVLTEPYGGYCSVGCAFSLPGGERVDTPTGPRRIDSFRVGDVVWGRSNEGRVATPVLGTSRHLKIEGLVRLVIDDGRVLTMTGDHPVYSRSRGWVAAETLVEGEELEDANLHRMSCVRSEREEVVFRVLEGEKPPDPSTSETVPRLRRPTPEPKSSSLRQVQSTDKGRQRKDGARKKIPRRVEAFGRDQSQDVRHGAGESSQYGRTGAGAEICGVSQGKSGGRSGGTVRVQAIEETGVHGQEKQNFPHEIRVGSSRGPVLRLEGYELGVRAGSDLSPLRSLLRSRLQVTSRRSVRGSERVHDTRRGVQNQGSAIARLLDLRLSQGESRTPRHPYVLRVEKVPGAVEVFDIETGTGNFYVQEILVHNCYINSGMRGYRGTGLISVPLGYGEQIRRQLSKIRRGAAGYFSSFTDPFTPLENYYHNTQEAAEAFVEVGLPIFFLSRLAYPDWAIDLLTKNQHSYAQKSLNTSDPADFRRLAPGALGLEEHFAEITKLKRRGIYVSIQVNPIIPGVTSNGQIVELFRRLKDAGADHVIVKFVEAAYSWAPAMVERMKKLFGDRGVAFAQLFTQNIGSERTVDEAYRLRAHRLFAATARRLGLTYATCYEYRYERNAAGEILNKTGISIGRQFTTADQCHGHAVPVYARASEDEPFLPLPECPPSGCLYCAAENDDEPRCGDVLAGEATALRSADLKVPIGAGPTRRLELPLVPPPGPPALAKRPPRPR